jgi:hypothetical protein
MSDKKTYLGDGAYADFDGHSIILTTENGICETNRIVLEPEVYGSLLRFVGTLVLDPLYYTERNEIKTEVPRLRDLNGCAFAGPGRGDCEHAVGLPGKSVPGQHDGPDATVDVYGRPNGWCWFCWHSKQIRDLQKEARYEP